MLAPGDPATGAGGLTSGAVIDVSVAVGGFGAGEGERGGFPDGFGFGDGDDFFFSPVLDLLEDFFAASTHTKYDRDKTGEADKRDGGAAAQSTNQREREVPLVTQAKRTQFISNVLRNRRNKTKNGRGWVQSTRFRFDSPQRHAGSPQKG